ncbi:MAG: hypothetical protein FWC42_01260 [Proteobacteria bacterium]|nr:hypothetical protein [Pseudomonadota bacterium]
MKLIVKKPREFINPLLSKKSVSPASFETFKAHYAKYCEAIETQRASKQSEPNIVSSALKPFIDAIGFTSNAYTQTGQSGIALAILHNGVPAVIFEVKKHGSPEMISAANVNTKAFQEAVLYFMRERANGNQNIFHVIITDFYNWFVFDAEDFDRLFGEALQSGRCTKLIPNHRF